MSQDAIDAREFAERLESVDYEAFAWLLDITDMQPETVIEAKELIIKALRGLADEQISDRRAP